MASNVKGTVYLLHFDRPYHHAQHYIGWSRHLIRRLDHHAAGNGSRLMAAVTAAGIRWHLARIWKGDRYLERRLKNRKKARQICPVCSKLALLRARY